MTPATLTNRISSEFDNFINSVNLGKHGILSPQVITPKILYDELVKYNGHYDLPIVVDYNNVHNYYKLMDLQIFSDNNIIIFAIKIPLVEKTIFNLYHLISLPIQHTNTSIFSYIEPKQPYLLLSKSKTLSSPLQDLSRCNEYLDEQYLCKGIHTHKRTGQFMCEVQLLFAHTNRISDDCRTRNITRSKVNQEDIFKFKNNVDHAKFTAATDIKSEEINPQAEQSSILLPSTIFNPHPSSIDIDLIDGRYRDTKENDGRITAVNYHRRRMST